MHDKGGVTFTWMHTCRHDDVFFVLEYWEFLNMLEFLRINRHWCTLLSFQFVDLTGDSDARHLNTTEARTELFFLHDAGDALNFLQTSYVDLHPTKSVRIAVCEVNLVVWLFEIVLKLEFIVFFRVVDPNYCFTQSALFVLNVDSIFLPSLA